MADTIMNLEPITLPGIENKRPLVIAGPCSAETEDQVLETAKELAAQGIKIFRAGIWKPRTKPGGFEGVGSIGLPWLKRVKEETGMYVSTEVANQYHVFEALKYGVDILWIGARTAANPFSMQEIADALKGVDMHVEKGAIYGLVGPNGAGKSTLIRHITGVYKPDAGEVLIAGKPVYENKKVKAKFSYIPDEIFYFMQADTMEMKRFYQGIYPAFDEKLFYRLQEFFPNIDVKRSIRRLSKGMQKQVAFWLAICAKPELMILDEPVDGLDPVMRRQIWSIIMSEVAENQMTVLVSSHNLRELEDVCDHVGIMHQGTIMIERSLSDLQGSVSKIQVACQNGVPKLPEEFEVLHMSNTGRVYTLIVKGDPEDAKKALASADPAIVDVLPLTLEEIFIYEMGGADYEVKDILF